VRHERRPRVKTNLKNSNMIVTSLFLHVFQLKLCFSP
jgi:hypothetical protein